MTQNSAEGEFSRSETAGATQTTTLLLQTRHLSKDFGGVHAVAEVISAYTAESCAA